LRSSRKVRNKELHSQTFISVCGTTVEKSCEQPKLTSRSFDEEDLEAAAGSPSVNMDVKPDQVSDQVPAEETQTGQVEESRLDEETEQIGDTDEIKEKGKNRTTVTISL
jgi:hypothetical protein